MPSPIMRRKALGYELRKLRNATGESLETIADLLGCSQAKVGHIETGRNSPSKAELIVLMGHYGIDPGDRESFEELRKEASKRGWWSTYRLPSWFSNYVGMESDASLIKNFELELIPGLLQTQEYARAVTVLARHMTSEANVDRQVKLRLVRQEKLTTQDPMAFTTIISEAALHRCAQTPEIASGQFSHLLKLAKLPNIQIHILPFKVGLHQSLSGSFNLLYFPPDTWPPSAFQEYAVGGHLVDDQNVVRELDTLFGELQDRALSEQDSVELISKFLS